LTTDDTKDDGTKSSVTDTPSRKRPEGAGQSCRKIQRAKLETYKGDMLAPVRPFNYSRYIKLLRKVRVSGLVFECVYSFVLSDSVKI
jgi:hypothetical protein